MNNEVVKISFMDIEMLFYKDISFYDIPAILQYLTEIYCSSKIDDNLKNKIKNYLENYQTDTEIMVNYLEKIYNKFMV